MTLRLARRIALLLIPFYAIAYAGIVMAACGMDRGAMAQAMAMSAGDPCDDCPKTSGDSVTAMCFAHCTTDAQLASAPEASTIAPPLAQPLLAPPLSRFRPPPLALHAPPGSLPRRILLHSFQV